MTGPSIPSINVQDRNLRRILDALKQRVEAVDKAMAGMAAAVRPVEQSVVVVRQPSAPSQGGGGPSPVDQSLTELLLAPYPPMTPAAPPQGIPTGASLKWPCPAGNVPDGFLIEDGSTLNIDDYPDLFAVIGTTWGGDGVTTFQLPPGEGYYPIGAGPGLNVGEEVGANEIDLAHAHGTGTLAAAAAGVHNHASGTLTGASAGAHTHSVSGTAESAGAHTHTTGVGFPTGFPPGPPPGVVEVQSGTGTNVASDFHQHSGDAASAGNHTHPTTGAAESAGAHAHTVSGNTADAGSHTHSVSGETGEALTDPVDIRPLSIAVYWIIKT